MAVEKVRRCGYRKVGGIYLVADDVNMEFCPKLPIIANACDACGNTYFTDCSCGHAVVPSRGFAWVNKYIVGPEIDSGAHGMQCSLCTPSLIEGDRVGVTWLGSDYTPQTFIAEAARMGVSRRVGAVPKDIEPGKTWVLVGHWKDARIFTAFRVQRVEQIVTESFAQNADMMESLRAQGITPVVVPDNDPDHR